MRWQVVSSRGWRHELAGGGRVALDHYSFFAWVLGSIEPSGDTQAFKHVFGLGQHVHLVHVVLAQIVIAQTLQKSGGAVWQHDLKWHGKIPLPPL